MGISICLLVDLLYRTGEHADVIKYQFRMEEFFFQPLKLIAASGCGLLNSKKPQQLLDFIYVLRSANRPVHVVPLRQVVTEKGEFVPMNGITNGILDSVSFNVRESDVS
jgi:hypothetical protein